MRLPYRRMGEVGANHNERATFDSSGREHPVEAGRHRSGKVITEPPAVGRKCCGHEQKEGG